MAQAKEQLMNEAVSNQIGSMTLQILDLQVTIKMQQAQIEELTPKEDSETKPEVPTVVPTKPPQA